MLEKAKGYLIWIITPVIFIAGFIFMLLTQNEQLKEKIDNEERQKRIDKFMGEEQNEKHDADHAEQHANDMYAQYLAELPNLSGHAETHGNVSASPGSVPNGANAPGSASPNV